LELNVTTFHPNKNSIFALKKDSICFFSRQLMRFGLSSQIAEYEFSQMYHSRGLPVNFWLLSKDNWLTNLLLFTSLLG
jgi:hypothetical protein